MIHLYNEDCLEAMKRMEDKKYSLAIVDPPYGLNIDGQKEHISKVNPKYNRKYHEKKIGIQNAHQKNILNN